MHVEGMYFKSMKPARPVSQNNMIYRSYNPIGIASVYTNIYIYIYVDM